MVYSLAYELVPRLTHVPTQTRIRLPYSLLVSGVSGLYEYLPPRPGSGAHADESIPIEILEHINDSCSLVCSPKPGEGEPPRSGPAVPPDAGALLTPQKFESRLTDAKDTQQGTPPRLSPAAELVSTLLFHSPSERFGKPDNLAQFSLTLCDPLPLYGEYSLELELRGVPVLSSHFTVGFCLSSIRSNGSSPHGQTPSWSPSRESCSKIEARTVPHTVFLDDWISLQPLGSHRARSTGPSRVPPPASTAASPNIASDQEGASDQSCRSENPERSWSDSVEADISFSSLSRSPSPREGRKAWRSGARPDRLQKPKPKKPAIAAPPPRASSRNGKQTAAKAPSQVKKQLRKLLLGIIKPETQEPISSPIEDPLTAIASKDPPKADKDHASISNEDERKIRGPSPGAEPVFPGGVEYIMNSEAVVVTLRVCWGECLIYIRYKDSDTSESVLDSVIVGSKVLVRRVELACTEKAVDIYVDGEYGKTITIREPEYSFGFQILDKGCCLEVIDAYNVGF